MNTLKNNNIINNFSQIGGQTKPFKCFDEPPSELMNSMFDVLPYIAVIILIIIVFMIIAGIFVLINSRSYIRKNWSYYKCNPIILPFASFFGKDTNNNLSECLKIRTGSMMKKFLEPMNFSVKIINKIFKGFGKSINDIRKVINKIRMFFAWIVKDIMKRFQDSAATLQFFFAKLKDIFAKVYAIFIVVGYMMFTAYMTFMALWNGPIGWTARMLCFDGDTDIILNDNAIVKIKNLKINQKLKDGSKIIAKLKFKYSKDTDMYSYKNIIVSGDHRVMENGIKNKISDLNNINKIEYNKEFIYCLITDTNKIIINNVEFLDFIETNDYYINNITKKIILNNLNNKNNLDDELHDIFKLSSKRKRCDFKDYYLTGFKGNTIIQLKNNTYKKIKNLNIDDVLHSGKINGIIKQKVLDSDCLYKLKYNDKFIILSGNQIIFYNNQWIIVKNIPNIEYCIKKPKYLYNICTDSGKIDIDNIIFIDSK